MVSNRLPGTQGQEIRLSIPTIAGKGSRSTPDWTLGRLLMSWPGRPSHQIVRVCLDRAMTDLEEMLSQFEFEFGSEDDARMYDYSLDNADTWEKVLSLSVG